MRNLVPRVTNPGRKGGVRGLRKLHYLLVGEYLEHFLFPDPPFEWGTDCESIAQSLRSTPTPDTLYDCKCHLLSFDVGIHSLISVKSVL